MPSSVPALGIPPPHPEAVELDDQWVATVTPTQMRTAIERFLQFNQVTMPGDCPLARWLGVLEEADLSQRNQTQFIKSMDYDNQRKAHDFIEARRLAWCLSVLYAPGRRQPDVDRSFITDQLLHSDDLSEANPLLRMPVGTFTVHFAARLQQAEAAQVRICGRTSQGVDLIYQRANGGVALIEQKERAYYKSRRLGLEPLVRDVRSRVLAAAEGLKAVTEPSTASDDGGTFTPMEGARVVMVGASPTREVARQFYDAPPGGHSVMAKAMSAWQLELSKRGASYSPHGMGVFCLAHDIEPTTMVSAALSRFVDFGLVGGGVCDEHWGRVAEVFQKTGTKRTGNH